MPAPFRPHVAFRVLAWLVTPGLFVAAGVDVRPPAPAQTADALRRAGSALDGAMRHSTPSSMALPAGHARHADAAAKARASHLEVTPKRPASAADTARAAAMAATIKAAIRKYRDVDLARRDGYVLFLGDESGAHYVNVRWSVLEQVFGPDPKRPSTLVYDRRADRTLRLRGAMFNAAADTDVEELHRRVPLSVASWHKHVRLCLPDPLWDAKKWAARRNGVPLFGHEGAIVSKAACEQAGGVFHPEMFGWMVHANVFDPDPRAVWDDFGASPEGTHAH